MIYLACPYSDPDPQVRERRFREASRYAAALMRAGCPVYAPVVHGHPIAECGLPGDWSFWEQHSLEMLCECSCLAVAPVEGWQSSRGVREELALASRMGMPIFVLQARLAQLAAG